MGLPCSSRSAISSAKADSETPQKRSIRLANTPEAKPDWRNQGAAVCCHIAFISLGTPGKVSTVKPGTGLQIIPGAVPVGFGSSAAPCGKNA